MVGGGSDEKLNMCVRVCLIDEGENVIFHTYVKPILAVTNYRYEVTGLTEEHLRDAMPVGQVQEKILEILQNGESISRLRSEGAKARLLVGHSLENDLKCLRIFYPDHMLSYNTGQAEDQAEVKKDQIMNKAANAAQSVKDSVSQTGQAVMDKAQGAADAVKDATGMNK
ncbi:hypothetical protein ACHQM5_012927 [Ranunculus cassubicifolius]